MNHELRNKNILKESFTELLQRQSFKEISVKDIVDNCDVSRSTFYRYFKDKYELMNYFFQSELDVILSNYSDITDWKKVTHETVHFIYHNKVFFKNIIHFKGQNSFLDHIFEKTHFYFISRLNSFYPNAEIPTELVKSVEFYCSGLIFILERWIMNDMKESPDTFCKWAIDFIPMPLLQEIENTI